ncbi:hypothetical protein CAI16_18865 [Virgibacillus dokdonensis]|uniref:SIS domain-containing protein n=1 Tax=Virgibacillus dokdonensis TaxID=302167 RepID=A0A3E0WHE1_9BACI|nr:bifunctional phosphoglucose/phosphomannose isomerase [Virgibacillus dokdonensis]RFA32188.1 hypothetical protein CAI16_18865 [Virgibacillus dokdonensis]
MRERLDNIDLMRSIDNSNMLSLLDEMHVQADHAIKIGYNALLTINIDRVRNIVFTGVGGSAIVADLFINYAYPKFKLPIQGVRSYDLPLFTNENTLLIVISYSGNTEETINTYKEAQKNGAQIITLSSGGKLEVLSEAKNHILIPKGIEPRAAIGYMLIPLIIVMYRIGLINNINKDLDDTILTLFNMGKDLGSKVSIKENKAKLLAYDIYKRLPIIYTDEPMLKGVGFRWKQQFNENSNSLSFSEHSIEEIRGSFSLIKYPISFIEKNLFAIILQYDKDLENKRIIEDFFGDLMMNYKIIYARGNSRLSKMFSLLLYSDYISAYLSLLYGFDPSNIDYIHYIKKLNEERGI